MTFSSDIGCYGSKIEMPNIDRLAGKGLRLLNHHTAAPCSPTHAMLPSRPIPAATSQARPISRFRGKNVHATRIKLWVPYFERGEAAEPPTARDGDCWALHPLKEPVRWELFNVTVDPDETLNLAADCYKEHSPESDDKV
ncbi:hypothetical protein SEUCBS139899_001688 [Sporothrix eucalyptigena]